MAASRVSKAARRAALVQAAIRDALAAGSSQKALHEAVRALLGELAKMRHYRPADGHLTDAEVAASLARLAADLPGHRPARPDGCAGSPAPEHLLAAFDATYAPREDQ